MSTFTLEIPERIVVKKTRSETPPPPSDEGGGAGRKKPKSAYHPNVKLDPEIHRLAELVSVHHGVGLAALCNSILKNALETMWHDIEEDLISKKRKKTNGDGSA